jgi:hypothetical protein
MKKNLRSCFAAAGLLALGLNGAEAQPCAITTIAGQPGLRCVDGTSGSLGSNAAWTPVSNGISVSGLSFVLTNSAPAPAAFYRLQQP